jgi:hypothetical protein
MGYEVDTNSRGKQMNFFFDRHQIFSWLQDGLVTGTDSSVDERAEQMGAANVLATVGYGF